MSRHFVMATPEAIAARIASLPTMPEVAHRALDLLRDPDTSADELRRVIESDPSLAASVLRLANSSLFGPARPTASLTHAIVLIGFSRLRSLTLATVVSGLRGLVPERASAERDLIWLHSVNTALAARALSVRAGLQWSDEAFVAGLMHDCGRQVLLSLHTDEYRELIFAAHGDMPTIDAERDRLGITHEEAGGALMRQWKMAPQLVLSVSSHHGPQSFEGPHGAMLALVALADRLMEPGLGESPAAPAEYVGLSVADFDVMRREIQREISDSRLELLAL